ncbi:MAG TPA: glycosyltransferase family 4 protein [Candidatus Dormibacteraeota bacterium]
MEHHGERLRIALVAPPWYPVPPEGYGGIELVIYLLAHQLAEAGNEVTVLGREGGGDDFEMVALSPDEWTEDLGSRDHLAREAAYVWRAYDLIQRARFDVVHDHSGYLGLAVASLLDLPAAVVATLHGDLDDADAAFLGSVDERVALVALSHSQARLVKGVRWAGVVPNAVDLEELTFREDADDYLLELARITPEKGQHVAIEVARRSGRRLVLAGKVAEDAREYFEDEIKPHLGDGVEWVENVAGGDKARLLAGAAGMIFPIAWSEPFGLAMVEAMASGTPVIVTPRGAALELVEAGVTGIFGDDVDGLVAGVQRLDQLDRRRCHDRARERFSPQRMAAAYEDVYRAAMA